ncbi:MAG: HD domain-containing phosphohydrolase, partial [Bacillota bacterium]
VKPDGENIWLNMNAKINHKENKDKFIIEGYVFDITKRKNIQKELEEKKQELFASNVELSAYNQEVKAMNEELEQSFEEMNKLNKRFVDMIELVAKMEDKTLLDEEEFFSELLDHAIEIVPEADYGKIGIIDKNDEFKVLDAIGHNRNSINNLKIKKNLIYNINKKGVFKSKGHCLDYDKMSSAKRETLDNFLKAIKESLCINIRINNNTVARISLDIKENNSEEFSKITEKILKSFANLASSFFAFKRFDKLRTNFTKELVTSVINLMEMYDVYTKGHSENVAKLASGIAEKMGLPKKLIKDTYWAGLVHDIGKLLIPLDILNKNGKLNDKEYELIKKHPVNGKKALSNSESLEHIARYVLHHHERWDGKGYPDGLKDNEIPLISQILVVADSWDAMLSTRAYREPLNKSEAINEIKKNKGTQFSPKVVNQFLKIIENESGKYVSADVVNKELNKGNKNKEEFDKLISFKKFFKESQESIVLLDENFNIIETNQYFKRMFEFKDGELTGVDIKKVVPEEKYSETDKLINSLKKGKSINTTTYRRKRNGEFIDVEIQAFPLTSNDNSIIGYYLIYRDISEKKKTEKELKREKNLSQNILDSLAANIVILDEDGVIRYTNKSWRNFAKNNNGNQKGTGKGVNYFEVLKESINQGDDGAKKAYQGIKDVMNGDKNNFNLEYPCHSPEEKRWFRMKVSNFNDNGPYSVLICHENITDFKSERKS